MIVDNWEWKQEWKENTLYKDKKFEIVAFSGAVHQIGVNWSTKNHRFFSTKQREIVQLLMLIHKRNPALMNDKKLGIKLPILPKPVLYMIISFLFL